MGGLEVLIDGFQLVEGPTVLADGGLAFTDVLGGGVHRLGDDGRVTTLVPKRRGVGGVAIHRDGGIVCTGRDVVRVVDGQTSTVLSVDGASWNDLAVDAQGRVWAGSVRFRVFDPAAEVVPGELWRIDASDRAEPVIEGIAHCNGVGFSPSGDRVYVADTRSSAVITTDLGGGDRRQLPLPTPDGLAVDVEGLLWVASYLEGRVVRIDPHGAVERTIDVGQPTTSVCLTPGGELYIATATAAGAGPRHTGALLRTRVEVAGLPLPAATV